MGRIEISAGACSGTQTDGVIGILTGAPIKGVGKLKDTSSINKKNFS